MEFKNIKELYERVYPALLIKKRELKQKGIFVTENEIWIYLSINIFKNKENLTLADIVNEILKLDNIKLQEYLSKKEEF